MPSIPTVTGDVEVADLGVTLMHEHVFIRSPDLQEWTPSSTSPHRAVEGTGIRAGILKCATDEPGVTPDVERVLRAVARAHLRTGVPISTHTHAPTRHGLDQQRIFREEGVNLGRVVIGHCDETTDLAYLEPLDTLAELCRRGYAGRIVLSHDRQSRHQNAERLGDTGRLVATLALDGAGLLGD